jgi:hypothetical protein
MKISAENWFKFAVRISIGFLIIGVMFKIMHWPGANIITIGSLISIGFFSAVGFAAKKPKVTLDYIRLMLAESFVINAIFTWLHWSYKAIPWTFLFISFILWIWYDGFAFSQNKTPKEKIPDVLLIVGGILVVIGVIFKVMHWPGAGMMLVIGFIGVTTSYFLGAFRDR